MENLEQKILEENSHYDKLKNKYYVLGSIFVIVGVIIGIIFSQIDSMNPIIAGLSIALYIGFGISVLMKSITVNHDRERAIREIKMDHKLDEITKKLHSQQKQNHFPLILITFDHLNSTM